MIWNDLFQSFWIEVPQTGNKVATHNSKRSEVVRNKVDTQMSKNLLESMNSIYEAPFLQIIN